MKVVVTSSSFSQNKALVKELKEVVQGDIVFNEEGKRFNPQELEAFLKEAEAAIVGLDHITPELLDKLPHLKFISKYGVGLDNIDLKACEERGIKIGWKPGVNKLSVAEMVLGYMLSLSRNLFQSSLELKSGTWKKNGGGQLTGKTVGIIGFGHIGQEVFRLLKPFQCKILANDINNNVFQNVDVFQTSKEEIYQSCDIITVHTPLTKETQNLLNQQTFLQMKQKPIIINSARGGLVNEDDIIEALNKKQISAYAVDAYINEPNPSTELTQRNDVFCTPHIGGNSREAVLAMGRAAIENIKEFIK